MSLEVHIEKKLNGFTLCSDFTAGNTATAILGASGCGKSMTLRCIAGIVKPDKGRIVLDGRVLFDSEQHIDLPPGFLLCCRHGRFQRRGDCIEHSPRIPRHIGGALCIGDQLLQISEELDIFLKT